MKVKEGKRLEFQSDKLLNLQIYFRNHYLARHADILQCIDTRISMLTMTYNKYIEAKLCCFIPGKVIDEVMSLLQLVGNPKKKLLAREVLQELRDITSMAIEHFDEKIAPDLKVVYLENAKLQLHGTPFAYFMTAIRGLAPTSAGGALTAPPSGTATASTSAGSSTATMPLDPFLFDSPEASTTSAATTGDPNSASSVSLVARLNARITREMKMQQSKQMRLIRQQNSQISEMRGQIAELKRRIDEADAKNSDIHLNVKQMKCSTASSGSSPFFRRPHIKPRTATVILKRRIEQFAGKSVGEISNTTTEESTALSSSSASSPDAKVSKRSTSD